jgi:hypothetical protein
LTLFVAFSASPAFARTLEVGPGKPFTKPSEAAAAAQDGDHIAIAKGEYFDCAWWKASNLVIEGAGPADTVITDKTCGGKALFIAAGRNITIRNLTLTRARVPDGNGAGIRAEGESLIVEHVRFVNNQDGILGGLPGSTIIVRDSEFVRNGACIAACAHGIYANDADLLRVEHSTFFETQHGHHIKSRALRTEVIDSDIQDGPQGTASYLIDVPNGGSVVIRGNTMEKGPNTENRASAISIGMEGITHPTREIVVENNIFRADGSYPTYFVNNATATEAQLRGNRISGRAKPLQGDGRAS